MVVKGLRDFRISEGQTRTHVSVIVRVRADDGVEGYGEIVSAPPGKPEEFLEEIVGAVERYAAPALLGLRVEDRSAARMRVDDALKGRVWTKAGIANALCDLHAKTLGMPVAAVIGGRALAEVPVRLLSTGQRRRAALARVVAAQAPVWLLDEPGNGLDAGAVGMLETLIARHRAEGGIALVATHLPIALPDARKLVLGA